MYIVYYTKYDGIFSNELDHQDDLENFVHNFDWEHGDIISITKLDRWGEMAEK